MEAKLRALGADIERVTRNRHDARPVQGPHLEETLPLLAAAGIEVLEDPKNRAS